MARTRMVRSLIGSARQNVPARRTRQQADRRMGGGAR
jgi:hypothetical protein